MSQLKDLIGRLTFIGGQRETAHTLRRFSLQVAKAMKAPADQARKRVEGLARVAQFVEDEAGSWLDPEDLEAGHEGPFDACDLRHWLLIAEKAGVPAVPAREILSLSEDELGAIDQTLEVPDHVMKPIRAGLKRAFPELEADRADDGATGATPDPAEVSERLFTAMDDIPSDWMVRTNISGSSMLKGLAGTGLIEDEREGAKLTEDVEVGAGWVRVGNRPRIDATDKRFTETFARGHKDRLHYLARPWMQAGRRAEGPDPHRHGSQFAGKGSWPMEWRCFVEGGRVTGVASYYGWVGTVTPENAAKALEAAEMAERIVAQTERMGLAPRLMDLEIMRDGASEAVRERSEVKDALARFPRDGVACTLDFMETVDGMMLLEGGPAHTPIGGGHPVAFAGHHTPDGSAESRCEGVALALMPGVCLGDPKSWAGAQNDGAILSWDEARVLAAERDATPEP